MTNEELVEELRRERDMNLFLALMNRNMGYVYTIARPYLKRYRIEEDELRNIAFLAFWDSVYTPDTETPFLSVLKYRLLHELSAFVSDSAAVSMPRNVRYLAFRYNRFVSRFSAEHGRSPTSSEIQRHLKIDKGRLDCVQRAALAQVVTSLSAFINDDGETELMDVIPDMRDIEAEIIDGLYRASLRETIDAILESLPAEEATSIRKHFFDDLASKADSNDRKTYLRAMRHLCRPSTARKLSRFMDENLFRATGEKTFRLTQTSHEERLTIKHLDRG